MDDFKEYLAKSTLESLQSIREARVREANNRERIFMEVTGGALVISVTFLSGATYLVNSLLLIICWGFLLFAILIKLIAYLTVDKHFQEEEKKIRIWRDGDMDVSNIPPEDNSWTNVTRKLNELGYVFLFIGLFFLVCFGISNINNMSKQEENKIVSVKFRAKSEPSTSSPSLQDRISAGQPSGKPESQVNSSSNQSPAPSEE